VATAIWRVLVGTETRETVTWQSSSTTNRQWEDTRVVAVIIIVDNMISWRSKGAKTNRTDCRLIVF